jgi:hypothetical protein
MVSVAGCRRSSGPRCSTGGSSASAVAGQPHASRRASIERDPTIQRTASRWARASRRCGRAAVPVEAGTTCSEDPRWSSFSSGEGRRPRRGTSSGRRGSHGSCRSAHGWEDQAQEVGLGTAPLDGGGHRLPLGGLPRGGPRRSCLRHDRARQHRQGARDVGARAQDRPDARGPLQGALPERESGVRNRDEGHPGAWARVEGAAANGINPRQASRTRRRAVARPCRTPV